ncbi:TnsA endonuclease N-terminal domain-containing protein [Phormidium sp. LEGE 05292]|uniref:TnsA endonuclease N-terminal domain-containing protein n=1 Tax=[Phormidium] sp. LEGE 05292 TaxID=767427 RepID=UPI001882BDC2|nr:TnsA endonuclease N-terminal domain-containing protein [Phormidium sp. LEGE 05292]MBE9226345.1 TnsA endonuclease N-terminal domain-containing protein [Phormidium sp. LEGE 05292]
MLSSQEFDGWCYRLNLPEVARITISQIRSTEPVRQVKAMGGNVSGHYCSQKMGKTLQFESHKVELPGIEEYESDSDVLEFYDQPYRLTLKFPTKKGQVVTITHIPDFFVIRQQSAGFEEWKTQAKLEKLAILQPNRYIKNQNGQWTCPPGEESAQGLGCYYRIRSDAEIDWIKYRNRQFLKSYTEQTYQINSEVGNYIKNLVKSQPGITYLKLLQYPQVSPDDINALIATEELYIDLSAAPLTEPSKVQIFCYEQTAQSYPLINVAKISPITDSLQIIDVTAGSCLAWDGRPLTVVQKGETKIVLRSEDSLLNLTHDEFDKLVQQGEIVGLKASEKIGIHPEAVARFLKASPEALAEANHRYQVIEPYLHGDKREIETVPIRTIRNWKTKYRTAEQKYNWGYIGLLNNHAAKGNRLPKISPDTYGSLICLGVREIEL